MHKRKLALSAATVLTAVAGIAGSTSAAHASSYIVFTNNQTGRELATTNCVMESCDVNTVWASQATDSSMFWSPQWHSDGSYTFTNYYGGCLDSNSSPSYSGTAGDVYVLPCNGGANQKWGLAWMGNSPQGWKLTNSATGLVLDSNTSGMAYMMWNNNGNYQRWSY